MPIEKIPAEYAKCTRCGGRNRIDKLQGELYAICTTCGNLRFLTRTKPKEPARNIDPHTVDKEELFIDIWYEMYQDLCNQLWYDGISNLDWIADFAENFPRQYRDVLNEYEKRLAKKYGGLKKLEEEYQSLDSYISSSLGKLKGVPKSEEDDED